MNATTIFIIVVLAVVVFGLLALIRSRNNTPDQNHGQLSGEYDLPVNNMGDGPQVQTDLDIQLEHEDTMTAQALSDNDDERNLTK